MIYTVESPEKTGVFSGHNLKMLVLELNYRGLFLQLEDLIQYVQEMLETSREVYKKYKDCCDDISMQRLLATLYSQKEDQIDTLNEFRANILISDAFPELNGKNIKLSSINELTNVSSDITNDQFLPAVMRREETATRLFSILAKKSQGGEVTYIFTRLATESKKSALLIQDRYELELLSS